MTATTYITEDELLAEYAKLDMLRVKRHEPLLTDEQFTLLSYARNGGNPVPWSKLVAYWESHHWGNIRLTTLKSRFRLEQLRRVK